MALRLDEAGADALVLFNRFLAPDIDPELLAVVEQVNLSGPADGRLPRAWVALLRGSVTGSLAATTGVESGDSVSGRGCVLLRAPAVHHGGVGGGGNEQRGVGVSGEALARAAQDDAPHGTVATRAADEQVDAAAELGQRLAWWPVDGLHLESVGVGKPLRRGVGVDCGIVDREGRRVPDLGVGIRVDCVARDEIAVMLGR
jgi:hypothetical protein